MTPEQLDQLNTVNAEVNAIPYNETPGLGEPPDFYTDTPIPGESWVCRMYTQDKASKLRDLGWPPLGLREFLCYVETGARHAVLAVDDPDGSGDPYILDSRFPAFYRESAPPQGYRWEARQVAGEERWEAIA
jgi:predicted transglutaminase-like cysteine proteinase